MRLTFNNVNKALKAAGFDAELVQGDGYLWFDSEESVMWYTSSIPVCKISHIESVEEWVDIYRQMKQENDGR